MKRALLIGLLLLGACDKDRLPDDLSSVEGNAVADQFNLEAEAEPELPPAPPSPPANQTDAGEEPEAAAPDDVGDPLAPAPDSDPSFDCSATTNRVERHICDEAELGALDRRVARSFDRAMDEATTEQAERLRNLGRRYIADRNRCRDDYCIRQAYRWYERDIYGVMGWRGPN